jgi:3-oxoacyl-[acyl-carrier-protein] synthase II
MEGKRIFSRGIDIIPDWPDTPPLSAILKWEGMDGQPPFSRRTYTLARLVGSEMKQSIDALFERDASARVSMLIATSHGDAGPLSRIIDSQHADKNEEIISNEIWEGVLIDNLINAANEGLERNLTATTISAACASSLVAISYAADRINAGLCDAVLIIAVDTLSRVASVGFRNIGASTEKGCRPFDRLRDGTTVGEGAIAIILAKQQLLPASEIAGYIGGTSVFCDAAHMVEPNPVGVASVVKDAISRAELEVSDISGIFWHGTGTRQNDKIEAAASEMVFGKKSPPCTSTKGSLGHTMGASAGFNVLAACEANTQGFFPHVAGTNEPEYPNLDLVIGEPRKIDSGPMLVSALGFGGINAAVVILNV